MRGRVYGPAYNEEDKVGAPRVHAGAPRARSGIISAESGPASISHHAIPFQRAFHRRRTRAVSARAASVLLRWKLMMDNSRRTRSPSFLHQRWVLSFLTRVCFHLFWLPPDIFFRLLQMSTVSFIIIINGKHSFFYFRYFIIVWTMHYAGDCIKSVF